MNDQGTKTIETERLIIRKFTMDDAEGMYNNWATDTETCKRLSWDVHKNVDETRELISKWIANYEKPYYYNWIVELKETKEVIGNINVANCHPQYKTAQMGYCYGSRYWGKGYATEALTAVLRYLVLEVGFNLVEAMCRVQNDKSRGVMERSGMKLDGVLRNRFIDLSDGTVCDAAYYSITKSDIEL